MCSELNRCTKVQMVRTSRPAVLLWYVRCFRNGLKKQYCTYVQVARLLLSSGEAYASFSSRCCCQGTGQSSDRSRAEKHSRFFPGARDRVTRGTGRRGQGKRPRACGQGVAVAARKRPGKQRASHGVRVPGRATSDLVPRISFCRCQRQRRSVTCMLMEARHRTDFTRSLPGARIERGLV